MSILNKKYSAFDLEDVRLMQKMMADFSEMHKGTDMPDYSNAYAGYLPVFAIALLASQDSVERLTKRLVVLTWVIAALTLIMAALTVLLSIKGI